MPRLYEGVAIAVKTFLARRRRGRMISRFLYWAKSEPIPELRFRSDSPTLSPTRRTRRRHHAIEAPWARAGSSIVSMTGPFYLPGRIRCLAGAGRGRGRPRPRSGTTRSPCFLPSRMKRTPWPRFTSEVEPLALADFEEAKEPLDGREQPALGGDREALTSSAPQPCSLARRHLRCRPPGHPAPRGAPGPQRSALPTPDRIRCRLGEGVASPAMPRNPAE